MKFKKTLKNIFIALFLILPGFLELAVPVSAVGETAVINPTSGARGTVITITGAGWGSYTVVGIQPIPHWGGSAFTTTANASGAISTTIIVPQTAELGSYLLYLTSNYGSVVSIQFTVVSGFNLTPSFGVVGSVVNVSGSGFAAGASVPLLWDNTFLLATATANSVGAISVNVTIPAGVRGAHSIATIGSGHTSTFTLGSKIALSATSGGAGVVVGVTGSGFGASNPVSISGLTGLPSLTTGTNATGSFTAIFTVPASSPRGEYTLTAADAGGSATAVFSVTQSVSITLPLGKIKVSPGDIVVISGQNFTPGPVTFKLDGIAIAGLTGTATAAGILADVNFTVPSIRAGVHSITAVSSDLVEASAQFTVEPAVTLSSATCNAGSAVFVSGAGFAATSAITITLGGEITPIAMTNTDTNGVFTNLSVTIPVSASGNSLITARDALSNFASAALTIQSSWAPNLSPAAGAQNVPVNPTDFDWADLAGATRYEFQIATGNSIPAGTDTVNLTQSAHSIPSLANGAFYTWRVRAVSGTVTSEWFTSVFSTVAAAPVTQTVTVTSPAVTVTQTQTSTQVSTVTQPPQVITITVTAPPVTITLAPPASAIISENTSQAEPGHVGMEINISGTGFKPISVITITFESTPITVATVTSDAGGSFLATFKVPVVAAGIHIIRATDGTTTKEFSFMMDSTPPAAVTLFEPVTHQPVAFTWSPGIDPSGVTYTLQIGADSAFNTVILEKTGLTTPDYRMAEAEKLEGSGPYYWRVRAVDLAGNVGAWSEPGSFTLGFIWSDWMTYAGIALGAVVILFLGLVLGRRSSYRY